ncbi:MAG: AAA family ATPase [Candidatus Krumholzibacteria bacterium]
MRIRAIRIDRYGPLVDFSAGDLANFTLVYGANEQGKTLLLDAILKLLFKKDLKRQSKHFSNIARVSDPPEGFLVLEHDGREINLTRKDSLPDHLPVTWVDFRNIFVVRDSDLSMVDEKDYYVAVSEKLSGLRTSEIEDIKQVLQTKGRLTNPGSDADLSDSAGAEHALRRVKAALELAREIDRKLPLFQNSGFDKLERRLVEVKERLATKERELKIFREAEVRGTYQKAQEDLIELKAVLESLGEISEVNEKDLEKWRELALDCKRDEDVIRSVEEQRRNKEKRLRTVSDAYAEARAKVESVKKSREGFTGELEPKLNEWQVLKRTRIEKQTHGKFWRWATRLSALLLVISVAGSFFVQAPVLFACLGLFLLLTVLSAIQVYRLQRIEARFKAAFEDLRDSARRFGVEIDSPDDVNLGTVLEKPGGRELELEQRKLRDADIGKNVLTGDLFSLAQQTRIHKENLNKVEDALSALKMESDIDTLEDYRRALKTKRDKETRVKSLRSMLSRVLGGKKDEEQMLQFWQGEIERHLSAVPGTGGAQEYNPDLVTAFETEIQTLKKQAVEIDDQLNIGRKELRDLELKITHAEVIESDQVVCRTISDLNALKRDMEAFVERVEKQKEDAQQVLRIFEAIESENKSKVVELFGADRAVSRYFADMTGGRYREVMFDPVHSRISARDARGQVIAAEKLSGGAADQLYLAIRLSVAQGVMQGARGFFLLDDAFVKADIDRLHNQLALLKTITDDGWQVIYFSAKKEVLDALQPNIATNDVRVIHMRNVLLEPEEPRQQRPASSIVELFPGDKGNY